MASSLIAADERGEIHALKQLAFRPAEILFSRSEKNVFRGFHLSPYRKVVYVVSGEIIDMFYQPETGESAQVALRAGEHVLVPAGAAHGFISTKATEVVYLLDGCYDAAVDRNIFWGCPYIAKHLTVTFPSKHMIVSEKDTTSSYLHESEYLVLGCGGYLGAEVIRSLEQAGHSVLGVNTRLEDLALIRRHVAKTGCKYVVCAAGISGRPTIDWCDSNEHETYRVNYLEMLGLMELCKKMGRHLTIFGSGGVFTGSKQQYTDDDVPDSLTKVYPRYRAKLEEALPLYDNVLYLRIIYPCTFDGHPKCFFSKLRGRASSLHDIAVSLTVVRDLFPLIPAMARSGETGVMNFVNEGTVALADILEAYNACHPGNKVSPITVVSSEEARGGYELTPARLRSKFDIRSVHDALRDYMPGAPPR